MIGTLYEPFGDAMEKPGHDPRLPGYTNIIWAEYSYVAGEKSLVRCENRTTLLAHLDRIVLVSSTEMWFHLLETPPRKDFLGIDVVLSRAIRAHGESITVRHS